MTKKRDAIIAEFFAGDDPGFIVGTFDGVLSGTMSNVDEALQAKPEEYRAGFNYGKYKLVMDNPLLFSRIITCGAAITFPEVVGPVDLMKGVPFDEEFDNDYCLTEQEEEWMNR